MDKMLITKLMLEDGGNRVALFEKGHRFKDLTLFDVSELADVGVDYSKLQIGVPVPCRFWALWHESDKLNQSGNPYKDIIALEPYDADRGGDPPVPSDIEALLAELRGIHAELRNVNALLLQILDLDLDGRVAPVTPDDWPDDLPDEELPFDADIAGRGGDSPALSDAPSPVLNEDQAYRRFNRLIGPAVREGVITADQAGELARQAPAVGWRDTLARLQDLLDRVPA